MNKNELVHKLPKPDYTLTEIEIGMPEKEKQEVLIENKLKRIHYIDKVCSDRFPEIADMCSGVSPEKLLTFWAQVLQSCPQDRAVLGAAKMRAIAHEQRPKKFINLNLTDIDFMETRDSAEAAKVANANIQVYVTSADYIRLPVPARKQQVTKLSNARDRAVHPLIFIMNLNINDLDKKTKQKLDAFHALGRHEEARNLANKLLRNLQETAISEYRQCVKNNTQFSKRKFRPFSKFLIKL